MTFPHPAPSPQPTAPPAADRWPDLLARPTSPSLRQWWPDALAFLGVVAVGLWEMAQTFGYIDRDLLASLLMLGVIAVAAALFRRAPGLALTITWFSGVLQLSLGVDLRLFQAGLLVVAYGAARYGSLLTVWLSGLSIPVAVMLAVSYAHVTDTPLWDLPAVQSLRSLTSRSTSVAVFLVAGIAVLATPWVVGLLIRLRESNLISQSQEAEAAAARDEAESLRAQAQEIADLRGGQARLARDVHDVVGHSLAVILAQAESAQFIDPDDGEGLHRTMANIAASARQSLREVRQVLSSIDDPTGSGTMPNGSLDTLLDDLRLAGTDVQDTVVGIARPLPPELETVTFRVLQEMLTNALKHGVRGEPVVVERRWADGLRIEVHNVAASSAAPEGGGTGLAGMRRRLSGVGGRLAVRRDVDAQGVVTIRTVAHVPLGPALRGADHATPARTTTLPTASQAPAPQPAGPPPSGPHGSRTDDPPADLPPDLPPDTEKIPVL